MRIRLPKLRRLNSLGISHILVPLVAVVLIGGIGSYLLVASHADSNSRCQAYSTNDHGQVMNVCVGINSNNGVSASGTYSNTSHSITSATAVLYQCAGNGSGCGVIAANSTLADGHHIGTSTKPFSFGHTYKACVSFTINDGWHIANACTALASFGHGYSSGTTTTTSTSSPITGACTNGTWSTTGNGGGSTYSSCVNGKWVTASCPSGQVAVASTSQTGPCHALPSGTGSTVSCNKTLAFGYYDSSCSPHCNAGYALYRESNGYVACYTPQQTCLSNGWHWEDGGCYQYKDGTPCSTLNATNNGGIYEKDQCLIP